MKENNNYNDKFDEIVRKKLENYTAPVDDGCWDVIEQQLKPRPKKVALWPWLSAAAVAACLILAWILFPLNNEQPYPEAAETLVEENQHMESIEPQETLIGETVIAEITEVKPATRKPSKPVVVAIQEEPVIAIPSETPQPQEEIKEEGQKPGPALDLPQTLTADTHSPQPEQFDPIRKKKRRSSLGLSVGGGNNLLASNHHSPSDPGYSGLRSSSIIPEPEGLYKEVLSVDDFDRITHYAPLSFGLSVRKDLTRRLALETGLSYSYLYSKFESNERKAEASLGLHYLGIPINLSYYLYNSHSKWSVYLSGGGMVEKSIASRYKQTIHENHLSYSMEVDDNVEGLQWSLNASLGVDYKLYKDISLYVEPKITYYLENNQPYSARTKNPFIFGINAGLRFGLN